ncbi:TIGR04282 family arsenosugar biosynthesis glycosyltransferase [Aurantiacibacter sp. D1-12]|uniref:TIGR04282 family arsenosugar biosynthesis glycosyltransferase n=1 Tax=Aurantiacibacter sp. D1-12 TaxID=2993658 RepID=UPI00237D2F01|nr:TIGR04282 family arsenosugar biosynthesis glycosyltransferase [Aurantiacibacter sp. D1-12]MDE1467177.1 TIGR04282 family arsenosugar biosynthesis glycosyltransferase [Aurantiacibacter sp. D1-12]
MTSTLPTIALFAKFPVAGQAKTRLAPLLGGAGAAEVHRRLVGRTVATIRESGLPFQVWTTGASHTEFAAWLGEDVALVEQGEGDLGARLSRAPAPAILLGADVPGLTAQHLREAADALETHEAVIGPASDGGYYLLGFARALDFLWQDMRWGTDEVLRETEVRLKAANVRYRLLGELDDCDRPEDLEKWPELVP